MSMFSDALGGIGYALDTPGALTRGLLSGQAGSRVSPRELLQNWGAIGDEPDDSWAGWGRDLAVGAATDPLTYLGALGGGLGGKAARGLIPAGAIEEGAIAGRGLAGVGKFKEGLRDVATVNNLGADAAASAGRGVSAPLASGERLAGEMSGRTAAQMGRGDVSGRLSRAIGEGARDAGEAFYNPGSRTIATAEGAAPNALRHERIHAIIDQASNGVGDASALPLMMRVPANLKASGSPMLRGLGTVGDELAAQTLENRTTAGQLQGAARYLFSPQHNAAYSGALSAGGIDPRVVAMYSQLPKLPLAAGGLLGGGAGGTLGSLGG